MDILNIEEHLRTLEELLLHQDFSSSPEALEAMLSEEFREVNPDGEIISRESVVTWLKQKDGLARWQFSEFEVQKLAPGLAQATYHAKQSHAEKQNSKGARHCSLWQLNTKTNSWQMVFHQSTRLK
ncbi:MAG: DUF4440 domain-containing protein [Gammaproteobacteria bacterium]|jgi:hypothetical protein|nr:DUF4440 domain-containing protein [Gammaproteobacteria bacterium]